MQKKELNIIARMSEIGCVESSKNSNHEIVHIHFMNTTIRMCSDMFESFALMLNEALMNIKCADTEFIEMKNYNEDEKLKYN